MEVFYLKVNQDFKITWGYLCAWLEIVNQFPNNKVYVVCDKPDLALEIEEHLDKNFGIEIIPSARDSAELKYIMDNAIVEGWHNAGYAHLTTFLHARDNGYKNFWNIDADDLKLCAKPRKIAKLFKDVKEYATKNELDVFSLDAGGKTFSGGILWNFGVSYAINPARVLEILRQHCTDDDYLKYLERFGDVQNVDWLLTYIRLKKFARLETFYAENLLLMHWYYLIYDVPLWGVRYWTDGRCHWSLMEHDFNMGDAASLPIPGDVIKFDMGITLAESRKFLKSKTNVQRVAWVFEIFNGIMDAGITLILPLNDSVENVRPCLDSLLKVIAMKDSFFREVKFFDADTFSNVRLIVTDAGVNSNALATCREFEKSFGGRMKILTDVPKEKLFEAGLQAAKGRYVMFIDGRGAFHPLAFHFLYDLAMQYRVDVMHLSTYVVPTSDKKFYTKTDELGLNGDLETMNFLPSVQEKIIAWFNYGLQKSIYNKLIRREFLEEEKISLAASSVAQWIVSLQLLLLSERYVRVPKPLYARMTETAPENRPPENFAELQDCVVAGKIALAKLDEEVLYFEEYDQEKIWIRNMYNEFLTEVFNSKRPKS